MADTKDIGLELTLGMIFGKDFKLEYLELFKIHVQIFEVPGNSQHLHIIEETRWPDTHLKIGEILFRLLRFDSGVTVSSTACCPLTRPSPTYCERSMLWVLPELGGILRGSSCEGSLCSETSDMDPDMLPVLSEFLV